MLPRICTITAAAVRRSMPVTVSTRARMALAFLDISAPHLGAPQPHRPIHIEERSGEVSGLPVNIRTMTNDFPGYLEGHGLTAKDSETAIEGYVDHSKQQFREILEPDSLVMYVQATVMVDKFIHPGHIALFPTDAAGEVVEEGVISFRNLTGALPGSRLVFKIGERPLNATSVFESILCPFLAETLTYNPAGDAKLMSEFRLFCEKAVPVRSKPLHDRINSAAIIQFKLNLLADSKDESVATTRLKLLSEIAEVKVKASEYYYLTDGWLITGDAWVELYKHARDLTAARDVAIETVLAKIQELDPTCKPEKVDASNCVTYVVALRGDKFKIEHLRPEAAAMLMLERFLEKHFARLPDPAQTKRMLAGIIKPVPDDAPTP